MEDRVNIPLLRKAVEWAEAEAAKPPVESEWVQRFWTTSPEVRARMLGVEASACGTAYCIAGWTVTASGYDFAANDDFRLTDGRDVAEVAATLLGIEGEDAAELFMFNNTVKDVRRVAERIAGERL